MLIVGGSFHPIHAMHIQIAYDVASYLKVREVLFIPNTQTPGKAEITLLSPQERFHLMCTEIFAFQKTHPPAPFLAVSQIELIQDKPCYTVDTLTEIAKVESSRYLLMGLDQFEGFSEWKSPEEILSLASVCVAHREGYRLPPELTFVRHERAEVDIYRWKDKQEVKYFKKSPHGNVWDQRNSSEIRPLILAGAFDHPWFKDYQPSTLELFQSKAHL